MAELIQTGESTAGRPPDGAGAPAAAARVHARLRRATALLGGQYNANAPQLAAGVVIVLIPMVAVFLFGQRALVRGITAGVGK